MRDRGEVRAVGLDQQTIVGALGRGGADVVGALERDDPGEAEVRPSVEGASRFVGTAGEAVEDEPLRDALRIEHVERVVPGVTGVDHERQADVVRQGDLGGERLALSRTGRVVVVVVEAALADRHRVGVR